MYLRNDIIISLHFFGLSSIPRLDANWEISSTTVHFKLGEHRGTISNKVVSSTNFTRPCQAFKSGLTRMAKRIGPSLVPWGRPTFILFQDEDTIATFTLCSQPVRKALIHLTMVGWTLRWLSSLIITL